MNDNIGIWKKVHLAADAAHRAALRHAGETRVLTEVSLVPKYATVAMRRALYMTWQRPRAAPGLPLLATVAAAYRRERWDA